MYDVEIYDKKYLKGKSEKELQQTIRGLKNKMGHLKNLMEHPDYQQKMDSEELTEYKGIRECLERVKQALSKIGGEYQLSSSEIAAMNFQDNLKNVTKMVFDIGEFSYGKMIYKAEIKGDVVNISKEPLFMILSSSKNTDYDDKTYSRKEFLELLANLHIGEWRKYYSTERFGISIFDGTQWSLDIYYSDGTKASYGGSNAYPYNFCEFEELIGVDSVFLMKKHVLTKVFCGSKAL
jgi:hypothetical protein